MEGWPVTIREAVRVLLLSPGCMERQYAIRLAFQGEVWPTSIGVWVTWFALIDEWPLLMEGPP